jgi:hypothetical protein
MSPLSIIHLIIEIEMEAYDNEPHPSRVLFIGPNKKLKDYYTLRT